MIEAQRLLAGIAATLERSILPAVESGFARGQLFAVLEVLGGLEGQLDWGGMLLEAEADELAALCRDCGPRLGGEIAGALARHASLAASPLADRVADGRRLVCRLIDEGHADDGEVAETVNRFLANDTLRKAMSLRPTRLAEISHG